MIALIVHQSMASPILFFLNYSKDKTPDKCHQAKYKETITSGIAVKRKQKRLLCYGIPHPLGYALMIAVNIDSIHLPSH